MWDGRRTIADDKEISMIPITMGNYSTICTAKNICKTQVQNATMDVFVLRCQNTAKQNGDLDGEYGDAEALC